MSQENVVWLMFFWHEENDDAVHELDSIQRGYAHVQENAVQNRHGYFLKFEFGITNCQSIDRDV